jgi:hypothetical protein
MIENVPLLGAVESAYTVEQAGLAGAVRTDDGQNLVFPDFDADIGQGFDASERKRQVLNADADGAI